MTRTGYFITGTDTGIGKTFVTAALAERLVSAGKRVFAFKPIETGCPLVEGSRGVRRGEDQQQLAKAAGDWQRGDLRNLYCFELPLAPLVAARAEGRRIDLEKIEKTFVLGSSMADITLVEGAGGWRVPITETEDMGSLAKRLGLPVIVIANAKLGTINHTLLTVEAARHDGCVVAQIILSSPNEIDEFARSNADEIRRRAQCLVRFVRSPNDVAGLLDPEPTRFT